MVNYIYKSSTTFIGLVLSLLLLQGCNTGETQGIPESERVPAPPPYWQVATPDFSDDPDRPVVALTGPHVMTVAVGEPFTDPGATASDAQDGDLTSQIVVDSQVNTEVAGDYFVRYQVSDTAQKEAFEAVRIVRVVDQSTANLSPRPFGSTQSHLGYIEHLPADYGLDPDKTYPIMIYNHGNAANVEFSGNDPLAALDLLVQNAGPPLLINSGSWDSDLPFIVLMPQVGNFGDIDVAARIDAFVEYALNTYAIDESRLYMTGWSQGGFLSLLYGVEHASKVAAVVSVSGGFPANVETLPDNFCDIETVPVWAFHGDADDIVSVESSVDSIALINDNCQPTELPRLTIFEGKDHVIHHSVFNLTAMSGGSLGNTTDARYDAYDQSVYDWLLSFSNP